MDFLDRELNELKKIPEEDGIRITVCNTTIVRVEFSKTKFKKFVAVIRFPEDYPSSPLIVELKSKTLSQNLLEKVANLCDEEAKNYIGSNQIRKIIKFLHNFLNENPLCCCWEEISKIKDMYKLEKNQIKLKQKDSAIVILFQEGSYFYKIKIIVPDEYPESQLRFEELDNNFPPALTRYFLAQSKEISRKSVEAPKNKKIQNNFEIKPSLYPVASFLHEIVQKAPTQQCQICKKGCLPLDPKEVEINELADNHVERIYCGHFYHLKCLIEYMQTPPFRGGKKCHTCSQRIYHEKYKLTPETSEARWASKEARIRELEDVADFLK